MSKMKQLNTIINEMEETAKDFLRLVDELKQILTTESDTPQNVEEKSVPLKREISLEDVRAVLATKAKDGYKDDVRALLNAYGATSLSTLDSKHYEAVLEEAGGIGYV